MQRNFTLTRCAKAPRSLTLPTCSASPSIVLEHGGKEDEAIAALLHDAIEDQGLDATRQQIRRRFGEEVAKIVDGCTDSDVLPKPPWKFRKQEHIGHLGGASPSISECMMFRFTSSLKLG